MRNIPANQCVRVDMLFQKTKKRENQLACHHIITVKMMSTEFAQDGDPSPPQDIKTEQVGEFWFDNLQWEPDVPYVIREFMNQPKVPFFKRNSGIARELVFFFSLITIGSIIVGYRWEVIHQKEFLASMFFASGFIPAVQMALFEILPRKLKRRKVEVDDYLSGVLAIAFLSVALAVYPIPEEEEDAWVVVVGKTLFEAGLIYFVTRVLFFVPNPNDEVRELKEEVKALKQSMAIGLADGYFWNLVKEIAIDIRDANGPQNSLKLQYPRQGETFKLIKQFLVIVPRSLGWEKEDPIADFIRGMKHEGYFKDCQIEKSLMRGDSSRIKWVTDVNLDPKAVTTSEGIERGIVVDIPTTLTALLMNLKSQVKSSTEMDKEKFALEASSFSYRLSWQLKKNGLDSFVKVVEVENLNDLLAKIRDVDQLLHSADQFINNQ